MTGSITVCAENKKNSPALVELTTQVLDGVIECAYIIGNKDFFGGGNWTKINFLGEPLSGDRLR